MCLSYPIFATKAKENMVYVFFKEKDLKATNTNLLSKNVFKNVTLIDSQGNVFKIKRAYKVKYIGLFGFSLLKKGRQILVDFEFENDKATFELPEFKQFIIQKIENNKSYWNASWDIDELKSKIMNCNSFADVASLIK
jgi:hypothetical protein